MSVEERVDILESFKRQESTLVLLNLAVLASLVFVHAGFLSLLGPPSRLLLIALTLRFLTLIGELLWLQNLKEPLAPSASRIYSHLSIWVNISFAFLASYLGGVADSHYSVLMVLPVISAAYRFKLPGTLAITLVTITLTILEVWLYFRRHPPVDTSEYFEAATVSLIFLAVAVVVWLLVNNLRREEVKLRESLTELQTTQSRLVAEEKLAAVGRLASAIAHEIRNPVAMISSSLATAGRQSAASPVREEMFEVAAEESARLEKLTTDFLSYARTKAPERKRVHLADTLCYVASLTRALSAERGVEIRVDVPSDLTAFLDDFQIQRALLNLITNALDSTPAGGYILLGANQDINGEVNIFVENSGEKVCDEVVSRIFEPFFTTKQKGTGLGLAVVRNIAEAHGGEAMLEENEPGRVRFLIRIPVEVAATSNGRKGNGWRAS